MVSRLTVFSLLLVSKRWLKNMNINAQCHHIQRAFINADIKRKANKGTQLKLTS